MNDGSFSNFERLGERHSGGKPSRKKAAGGKRKRGYTYEFTPAKPEAAGRYLVDRIPAPLWRAVKAQSKREGISIRHFILSRFAEWVAEPAPAKETIAR